MIMINSDSNKRLRFSIPRTTKNDLLKSPTSEKLDDINNNLYPEEKTSIDCNNTMKPDILSLNHNENNTTLLTTTTTTTTVEVKVKTTKTSSRKRKLNVINDMNNDNVKQQQIVTKKKKKQRVTKIDDDDDNKKTNSKTVDQSSITDESSFGSCEPGTNVVLQGIVWNETDKGVLVVNITWRGKTYVGALLNTTEQNWAPPRYKSDVRPTKSNYNRDHQLTPIPSSHESTERILRNGKRRGSSITVPPSPTTKTNSFKIPEAPPPSSTNNEKLILPSLTNINDEDRVRNLAEDETGDNSSSRSVSPTTSGSSTTSSSPLLSNNTENQSTSIPVDLSNSKPNDTLIPYHFFPPSSNPSAYFSSLHGSTNPFSLPSFNKLSSTSSAVSSSSYLPIYFNSYPPISSLSKSSR